jgi:hypothetical protein
LFLGYDTYSITNFRLTSPGFVDNLSLSREQSTFTDPWGVNFTAFPMRFIKTMKYKKLGQPAQQNAYPDECEYNRLAPLNKTVRGILVEESARIHAGTSRSILKERSSFFAAIGRSSSMQS